ncbi:uncharacterized protein LOC124716478 [Schistocerca piceifrons]|uniref:uncharacterized protein LOC124716478 n=1 Tax=Schistocerca piceifrons TaxID=274613 RepID=UPI001F5E4932|nr:uncharacterized protein LOC124716478 [Schistocerca piceifrons]
MALVANMWGECSAVILSTHAVMGPSSCLPQGYPMNGRVEAGSGKFKTAQDFGDEPSQGRIIDRFIKRKREKRDSDSLMIMKLLEPFYFTPFVQAIHVATKTRRWIARKLREINYIAHMKPHEGDRGADIRSRSSADSWHGDFCARWPSAGLFALACALC